METIRVSSMSVPSKVAGALSAVLREKKHVQVQVIGAAALNQAIKSIAILRGYMVPSGFEVKCTPSFYDIEINGETVTSIRLYVELK